MLFQRVAPAQLCFRRQAPLPTLRLSFQELGIEARCIRNVLSGQQRFSHGMTRKTRRRLMTTPHGCTVNPRAARL